MVQRSKVLGLICVVLIIVAFGCDSNRVYDTNIEIENNHWSVDDVKTFNFQIVDTTLLYNVFVNVRNNSRNSFICDWFLVLSRPT